MRTLLALGLSGWKPHSNRCSNPAASRHCQLHTFPNQEDLASRFDRKEIQRIPGFVSPYAATAAFEDFAESFTHFRYNQDFYKQASQDPVLRQKQEYMRELFGASFESRGSRAVN